MDRVAGRLSLLVPGLLLIIVSGTLGNPMDEPKPKPKPTSKTTTPAKKDAKTEKIEKDSKTETDPKAEEFAKRKDAAFKVAEAYLVLLDKGKFGESWETMTAEVRKGITRRKWVDLLGKTRTPYGKLQGRKLKKIQMRATEVADRFDEAWIYADFRTVDGVLASELIIVCLEKGKDWVVSSYYIGDPDNFPKPPAEEEEPETKPAKK